MRCRKEDLGKWLLPRCLSPSSSSTVSSYGLFSAMEAEVSGAQCQVLSSFTGPGVQVEAGDGGLPLLLPHPLSQAFLALRWILELESQFTGSLTQRPGWDKMWQSDKTQRENMVPKQERELYICTDENSNSQSQSKKKKKTSFECYFFSARVACALLITPCTALKVDGPRGTHSRAVCSSSSGTGLFGSWHFDLNPKVNPYMASQLSK